VERDKSSPELSNLDDREEFFRAVARFDESRQLLLADVPRLGLAKPTHSLRAAINWAFVEWHRSEEAPRILHHVMEIARRGVDISRQHSIPPGRAMRDCFDNFLLQCAVLSGDRALAQSAATTVAIADSSDRYQYLEAWTGIIASRLLGNRDEEMRQREAMRDFKPSRTYLWPSQALIDQFVDQEYHALGRILKTSSEKHWKISERDGALTRDAAGRELLDLSRKHEHFFWPYVEAVFARLAIWDGAPLCHDSFWLPAGLIRG
jgi:hypothetical protein